MQRRPTIVFMWEQFSAYHIDRLEAVTAALGPETRVIGIEVAPRSRTYAWEPSTGADRFERRTMFPAMLSDDVPWYKKYVHALRTIRSVRATQVFLCNQEQPEILALSTTLRLLGIPPYAMLDAKFDDVPRKIPRELLKPLVLRVYKGGLVSGNRSAAYYRFLGLPANWSRLGYDTLSVERVREMAARGAASGSRAFAELNFVMVARFVPKKQINVIIDAFARFKAAHPRSRRRLVLVGSGELEPAFRSQIRELGVQDVDFPGFLGPDEVAQYLVGALALVLASIDEQWGLVVNEAIALGVPILCSENVGARDSLMRVGVNGFIFEPGNSEGLAVLMELLAGDEQLWLEFHAGSQRLSAAGDVSVFVQSVCELTGAQIGKGRYAR